MSDLRPERDEEYVAFNLGRISEDIEASDWRGQSNVPVNMHRESKILILVGVFSCAAMLLLLARKAWVDFDTAWDSIAYHLPCAALRSGIMRQSDYHLSKWIQAIYGGFPALPDILQGWLWKVAGKPQGANLLNLIGLSFVACAMSKFFGVPAWMWLLGCLCVPIVLIQATSTYNDIFGNCFLFLLVFIVFFLSLIPSKFSLGLLVTALICFSMALNSKLLLLAPGSVYLAILVVLLLTNSSRLLKLKAGFHRLSRLYRLLLGVTLLALFVSGFANELKNEVEYKNPVYPIALHVGPIAWEGSYSQAGLEPAYLKGSPQCFRWLFSVMEFRAFEGRNPLWTNAQGDVPTASYALRMGGYFAPFALGNVFVFLILTGVARRRFGFRPLIFFCFLTFVTSFLPASQELRYYLYWLMFLIAANIFLIREVLPYNLRLGAKASYAGFCLICCLFVLCSTGFRYLQTTDASPEGLVHGLQIDSQLNQMHVGAGERICVINKNPLTLLYAPIFNVSLANKTHYRVMEAYLPEDCLGARVLR